MLRDLGQKDVSSELFIMTFPISLGLLQHFDNAVVERGGKHVFFEKFCLGGSTFFGLKFDIFSIPNFLGTFYVLGSFVENDLNASDHYEIRWLDTSDHFVFHSYLLGLGQLLTPTC